MDKWLVAPCVLLSFSSLNRILFLIFPSEAIILNPLSNQHSKMKMKNHTNVLYLCPLCSHQPAHLDMSGNYFGVIFVPAR